MEELNVDTKLGEVMRVLPGGRRALFARYHLGGCQSCAFSEEETLAGLCTRAELDAEEVLAHLLSSHEHDQTMLLAPVEVKRRIDAGEDIRWVDVRTREEHEAVTIAGAAFFNQELQEKIFAEKPGGLTVLFDHKGRHVLDQVAWFRGHGLANTFGLTGGIDAWSREVDRSVGRYALEIE
jgi:rhodanese-related sulfurtransferase